MQRQPRQRSQARTLTARRRSPRASGAPRSASSEHPRAYDSGVATHRLVALGSVAGPRRTGAARRAVRRPQGRHPDEPQRRGASGRRAGSLRHHAVRRVLRRRRRRDDRRVPGQRCAHRDRARPSPRWGMHGRVPDAGRPGLRRPPPHHAADGDHRRHGRGAPPVSSVLPSFLEFVHGAVLVGHNVGVRPVASSTPPWPAADVRAPRQHVGRHPGAGAATTRAARRAQLPPPHPGGRAAPRAPALAPRPRRRARHRRPAAPAHRTAPATACSSSATWSSWPRRAACPRPASPERSLGSRRAARLRPHRRRALTGWRRWARSWRISTVITEVFSVTGGIADVIAIVRVRHHDDLADVVTGKIATMDGDRVKTTTLVAFQGLQPSRPRSYLGPRACLTRIAASPSERSSDRSTLPVQNSAQTRHDPVAVPHDTRPRRPHHWIGLRGRGAALARRNEPSSPFWRTESVGSVRAAAALSVRWPDSQQRARAVQNRPRAVVAVSRQPPATKYAPARRGPAPPLHRR